MKSETLVFYSAMDLTDKINILLEQFEIKKGIVMRELEAHSYKYEIRLQGSKDTIEEVRSHLDTLFIEFAGYEYHLN